MLSEKPLLSRIQQMPGFLRGKVRVVAGSKLPDLKVRPPKVVLGRSPALHHRAKKKQILHAKYAWR